MRLVIPMPYSWQLPGNREGYTASFVAYTIEANSSTSYGTPDKHLCLVRSIDQARDPRCRA